jgi:hypothetical protein
VTRLLTSALLALGLLALAVAAVPAAGAATLQPTNLRVADGNGWHPLNDFRLSWDRLPGEPPARMSYLQIRDNLGNVIPPVVELPWDGLIEHVQVPRPGVFRADVWLEDFAGNIGPPVGIQLAFDDVRPGAVQLQGPSDWIGAKRAATIRLEPPALPPLSGIGGYAFSVDHGKGSSPCAGADRCRPAEIDVSGGASSFSPGLLPEGTNVVRVLAVSGSGMRTAEAASALVRVDATAPQLTLDGPRGWVNGPRQVVVSASDSASGMAAAGPTGPYTAIAVDGGVPHLDPGATTAAVVSGEGEHQIAAYARDAAGNASDETPSATLRIDETPPRVAFLDAEDPAEPERIEATVGDSLSGADPARGSIALRPAGSRQRWRPLPTSGSGGRLVADWDSDAFAAGAYEFRATGYDAAGNAGIAERRSNGERMTLTNPVKTPTRVLAGFGGSRLVWQRCSRDQDRRHCRHQEIESFEARPTKRTVPYGRGIPYSGRLTTSSGSALGGLPVEVVESFASGGPAAQRTTVTRTAADGSFALRLAPGPSRGVEVVFAGTRTLTRAGGGAVALAVQAGVRLHPSSTSARVGGAPVVFRGRVADPAAVPAGGLPVELQFRLPGREWAEFRTVQSDGNGRFRYAYGFSDDDSRGIRFQFRAFVPSASGWPYEPATSRPAFVTGR